MAEDMTWDESAGGFAAANSALIQRVRELEAECANWRELVAINNEALKMANEHIAMLQAKLDAVPIKELLFWYAPFYGALTKESVEEAGAIIDAWAKKMRAEMQPTPEPDDADEPLILAGLDDDEVEL